MELSTDKTFGSCEYCGSVMTLPKVDGEQTAAAFNRGNHFRRAGEFDKALAVYERIVEQDDKNAEAHWCCALCRFGIEYVEDPESGEWFPTCHRLSFDSFLEDVDYLAALEYADAAAKSQYRKDGEKIAQVQEGILATSQREEAFDVFLCYKESEGRWQPHEATKRAGSGNLLRADGRGAKGVLLPGSLWRIRRVWNTNPTSLRRCSPPK